MGNRHFFDSTSEAKCPVKPRSGVAKSRVSVKAVSAEAVCTLTTTPLPWQQASEASGLDGWQKMYKQGGLNSVISGPYAQFGVDN